MSCNAGHGKGALSDFFRLRKLYHYSLAVSIFPVISEYISRRKIWNNAVMQDAQIRSSKGVEHLYLQGLSIIATQNTPRLFAEFAHFLSMPVTIPVTCQYADYAQISHTTTVRMSGVWEPRPICSPLSSLPNPPASTHPLTLIMFTTTKPLPSHPPPTQNPLEYLYFSSP